MADGAERSAQHLLDPGQTNQAPHSPFLKKVDLVCFALIIVFGVAAIFLRQRTTDFMGEDAFYADAAQSILHHGYYGVNGNVETTQPPGLSGILAILFAFFGYSYAVSVAAMAVFETLGFLATYELLRRRVPWFVAATIVLILLSSPAYFATATRLVYSCLPYFSTTMFALLAVQEYDKAATVRSRIAWGVALTVALVTSLLIATGTIALLGAMCVVIVATAFKDMRLARTRLLKFLPILLVGIMVQAVWTHRKPAPLEWSLPGYPASYLNQLRVKSGNYPELGMATWKDIPGRIKSNLFTESDILAQLVLRHGVSRTKTAVVIAPILLILIGWMYSVWKTGGTEVADWYFVAYETVYLLWPWTMEPRFVLPVAPLACFYMWQGVKGAIFAGKKKPRIVGIIWFPIATFLTISGGQWILEHRTRGFGNWPDELLIPGWLISAECALWMAYSGRSILSTDMLITAKKWLRKPLLNWRVNPLALARDAGAVMVMGLVLIGLVIEKRIARENLNTTSLEHNAEQTDATEILAPEVEAGMWIRAHTPLDSVVMARHWPTVYHYADRKLIWFAPVSDPVVLINGIVKHGVDYLVVIHHPDAYYLPDDDYCFERLSAGYPGIFQLVLQKGDLRIYWVDKNAESLMRSKIAVSRRKFSARRSVDRAAS
jgi:hypothetical protein